jgi:hypothetical protein
MARLLPFLVILLVTSTASAIDYTPRQGPLVQVDIQSLTDDGLSDGTAAMGWTNVTGYDKATLEVELSDAATDISALAMRCYSCRGQTSASCFGGSIHNLKSLTISAGAATVQPVGAAFPWNYAPTGSESWSLSIALNYRWFMCSWAATGSTSAATLTARLRLMASGQ